MRNCPTCGHPTPEGRFCVRCGAPLAAALTAPRRRRAFAAAPGQGRWTPWLVSTLFPQLPRGSERHVRATLLLGGVLVVGLAALRLFGVAMVAAALLMPLVTLVYLTDADVYGDQPAVGLIFTVVWGVLAGVAVGFLTRAIGPSGAALLARGSAAQVLIAGLLIPAVGVAAALAGPLVLLPYRRYDDTLDGASFGAASAASFAAAEVLVVGSGVLRAGLRPPGAAAPWVARLLALAVATPVLTMSAVGFAAAALWLRFRAPVPDRGALGAVGRPPVALALALGLVLAGAVSETLTPVGLWLAILVALDVAGLLLLRQALHVGLLEEAGEDAIGAEVRCANCGALTPAHTFCAACGIALRALPRARDGRPLAQGEFSGRLGGGGGWIRPLAGAGVVLAGTAAAFVAAALAAAPPRTARCQPGIPCGAPPTARVVPAVFAGFTGWRSPGLGYSLRWVAGQWSVASQTSEGVVLQSGDGISQIAITAAIAPPASAAGLVAATRDTLAGRLLGLAPDLSAAAAVLGPNIGFAPGQASVLRATADLPQAPSTPVAIDLLGTQTGRLAIAASVITPAADSGEQATVFGEADDILDSVRFPAT